MVPATSGWSTREKSTNIRSQTKRACREKCTCADIVPLKEKMKRLCFWILNLQSKEKPVLLDTILQRNQIFLSPKCANEIRFEPVDRIAQTVTTIHPDGNKTFLVSIDTEKIKSSGLFYNTLSHELGHVRGRKDMSSGIMDFTILQNQKGQLFQHSPYYKTNFPYSYYNHWNGSGRTVDKWS